MYGFAMYRRFAVAPTVLEAYCDVTTPAFAAPEGTMGPVTVPVNWPTALMPKSMRDICLLNAVVCAAAMPVTDRKRVAVASRARERLCIKTRRLRALCALCTSLNPCSVGRAAQSGSARWFQRRGTGRKGG